MELKPCRYCTCDQIQCDVKENWVIPFSRYCRNCRTYGPYKETVEEADEAWNVLMSPCTDKQAQSELLSTLRAEVSGLEAQATKEMLYALHEDFKNMKLGEKNAYEILLNLLNKPKS